MFLEISVRNDIEHYYYAICLQVALPVSFSFHHSLHRISSHYPVDETVAQWGRKYSQLTLKTSFLSCLLMYALTNMIDRGCLCVWASVINLLQFNERKGWKERESGGCLRLIFQDLVGILQEEQEPSEWWKSHRKRRRGQRDGSQYRPTFVVLLDSSKLQMKWRQVKVLTYFSPKSQLHLSLNAFIIYTVH